jgi:hypothetical protein
MSKSLTSAEVKANRKTSADEAHGTKKFESTEFGRRRRSRALKWTKLGIGAMALPLTLLAMMKARIRRGRRARPNH